MINLQNLQIASLQKKAAKKPQKKFDNTTSGRVRKADNSYKLPSRVRAFENEVSNKGFSLLSSVKKLKPLLLFRRSRTRILLSTVRPFLREANQLSLKSEDLAALFESLGYGKKSFFQLASPEEKMFSDLRNLYSFIDYKSWFNTCIFKRLLCSANLSSRLRVFTFLTPLTHTTQLTAKTILTFVLRRLKKYYFPQEIFPRLLNAIKNFNFYTTVDDPKGLSFICSGRVTRRQMASCYRYQVGATSKGTINSPLDYAQGVVALKYGTVGVKVYFTQSSGNQEGH